MSIIYSYPTFGTANGSDLLLASRFDNEPGGPARTINLSLDTIGSYISTNHAPTLNQVLTAGNESLLDAKIGTLYLYDFHNDDGYVFINGSKNRINFFSTSGLNYGHISQDRLFLSNGTNGFGLNILKPASVASSITATFQDASGTIAYLSDITNYGLASQIANSDSITNTTTPGVLNGDNVGSLVIPANSLSIGDSFNCYLTGPLSCNSIASLIITIETSGGVILATTGSMPLSAATGKRFELNASFVIRATGIAGAAKIMTTGSFVYGKNANLSADTFSFVNENATTFATTISNELVIKAQWGFADPANSISSNVFILNKVY